MEEGVSLWMEFDQAAGTQGTLSRSRPVPPCTTLHLALEGLQLVDLTLGVTVGVRLAEGDHSGELVAAQDPGECYAGAVLGVARLVVEVAVVSMPDHVGEALLQRKCGGKGRHTILDPGHGSSISSGKMITTHRRHPGILAAAGHLPATDQLDASARG